MQHDNDRLALTLNREIRNRGQDVAALAANQRVLSFLDASSGIDSQHSGLEDAVEDRAQQIAPEWLVLRNLQGQIVYQMGRFTASDAGLPVQWPYPGQAWLLRDPHSLQFILRVHMPIRKDGRVLGSLEAVLPLQSDYFSELALHERDPGHTVVVCARQQGGALCSPGHANEHPQFMTEPQRQTDAPEFLALHAEHGVVIRPTRHQNGNEDAMIVAYAPVASTGLGMVSQISARALFGSLITTSRVVLLLLPALLLVGLALLRWQLRPMVRRLHDSQQRVRIGLDYSGMGMATFGWDGRIQEANGALVDMLGFSEEELRRLPSVLDLLHPEDLKQATSSVADIFADLSGAYCAQRRYRCKSGDHVWVRLHVAPIHDEHRAIHMAIVFVQDVSELLAKADVLRRDHTFLQAVLDNMTDGVVACDEHGHIQYTNALIDCQHEHAARPMDLDEWARDHALLHLDRRPVPFAGRPLSRAFRGEVVAGAEFLAYSGTGELRQIQISSYPLHDAQQTFLGAVAMSCDLTEIRTAHAHAQWLAYHDPLTELPNRNKLLEYTEHAMARARRNGEEMALFFLEINRFKAINDTLGHTVGDQVLVQVAARLRSSLRGTETLGHVGDDEFAIVSEHMLNTQAVTERAEQLRQALKAPLLLGTQQIHVSASMGIVRYPADGDDVSALFSRADIAMHESKKKGVGQWSLYQQGLYARQRQMFEMEGALRKALDATEFVPYYQPKVDVATGRIVGAEALLRWQRPKQGLVAPAEFIPILEDTGLIVPVGTWMLNTVCAQQAHWRRSGITIVPVAVNCAVAQLQSDHLLAVVQNVLDTHALDPRMLELEITESVLMHEPERVAALIAELRARGVDTAIDDFGTGYSSLAYLKRLPVSALKIDRAFIKDLPNDAEDIAITKAVLLLARELGLRVVAEGVETAEQLEFLRSHGCDTYQGYFCSRPVPADEFAALLRGQGRLIPTS
ncbi:EAL domain-containing protein [Thiomonas sp. X19]|uniref:bifunctional diguanylate cyclase/phosphodiesterase n=1 Tax=Thiomonas sp. X19 TaxID=1050370 RepID=UPI001314F16B|nr:EAL domain-containing protein [Thiomonas sp. X19]